MYKAEIKDVPRLKELWKEIFKDTDSYIDLYFRERFTPEKTYVYRTDGIITTSLYYSDVPLICDNAEYRTAYICGIATDERMRGKGQASRLIKQCTDDLKHLGYDAAFLIPANPSLFDFYKRFGFEIFSGLNYSEYDFAPSEKIKSTGACDVLKAYTSLPGLKVKRTSEDFKILDECYGKPFLFSDGYIYSSEENGSLYVYEHNFINESELIKRLNMLPLKDISKIYVKSPASFGFGEKKPFSVFINFKNISFPDNRYINMLLN